MKKYLIAFSILFGSPIALGSENYKPEASDSSSIESTFSQLELVFYYDKSLKNIESFCVNGCVSNDDCKGLKNHVVDFFSSAEYLMNVKLSSDVYRDLSNIQNSVNNRLYSFRGKVYDHADSEVVVIRDTIVEDLEYIIEKIEDLFPDDEF